MLLVLGADASADSRLQLLTGIAETAGFPLLVRACARGRLVG